MEPRRPRPQRRAVQVEEAEYPTRAFSLLLLSREEFQSFLHPEDADHMRDIVITETLEDIDRDGDGRINVDEYIGDMYKEGEEGSEGESIELINCKVTKTA